jgi:hypothetical protein
VTEQGAFATSFDSKGMSSTAFSSSAGGNFFLGYRATHDVCLPGQCVFRHGGGVCRTPAGAEYQIMF